MNWEGTAGAFETVLLEDVSCMLLSYRTAISLRQSVALRLSFAHHRLSPKSQW